MTQARPKKGCIATLICGLRGAVSWSLFTPIYLTACLVLPLTTVAVANAQTVTGSVRGLITDPSGAVIPNAAVTAMDIETGLTYKTVTNGDGLYSIRFLPIGDYKVTVSAGGFAEEVSSPFDLEIDQQATINVAMHMQSANTQVTVNFDTAPILHTESPTLGVTVSANQIENMPMTGRDFTVTTVAVLGSIHTSGQMNDGPAVNGNRPETNSFILDGMDIYNQSNGQGFNTNDGAQYLPNPDALQEVHVITANAAAEYGNVNGGEVIAVTKSGTNQIHGGAFLQVEDNNLGAANTWNDKHVIGQPVAISPFTQTYFGGQVGGPILKDKLFYFLDFQGYRYHQGGTGTYSVPTEAVREGNFGALLTAPNPIQLFDYRDGGIPFQHDIIPTNYLNNPVLAYLNAHPNAWPLPTGTPADGIALNDLVGPSNNVNTTNQGDVKIDWKPTASDSLSGRLTMAHNSNGTNNDPVPVTFPFSLGTVSYTSFVINHVHVFSNNIVNEARIGYGRNLFGSGAPVDSTGLFGTTGNNTVGIGLAQAFYKGFSQQTFANSTVNSIGVQATGQQFALNTFLYGDDLSIQHGHHLFKMGAELLRYQTNFFYGGLAGALGTYNYSGNYSGYSFADFEQGYVDSVTTSSNTAAASLPGLFGQRQWRQSYFFQDDWKVLPNLTLNLGLRYDYFQPLYEVHNRETNVSLVDGSLIYAGQNGASRALYNPHYNGFEPRVGFAYSITPRFVARGGYGISSYFEGMGVGGRLTQNPPWQQAYTNTAIEPAGNSLGTPLSVSSSAIPAVGHDTNGNSYKVWDPNIQPSMSQMYSLTLEYQLNDNSSIQVGYVGEDESHLAIPIRASQWPAECAGAPTCPQAFYAANLGSLASLQETATLGTMNYNALQAVYRKRASHGLDFTANYTYSRSLTNAGQGWNGLYGTNGIYYQQNAFDLGAEYGPSPINSTHLVSADLVYELPVGRGHQFGANWNRAEEIALGGWKISGLLAAFTGNPLTITSHNYYGALLHDAGGDRANHLRDLHVTGRSINHWFGTGPSATPCPTGTDNGVCAYSAESSTAFGTATNGSEIGPGFRQIDISAFKAFNFTEHQDVEFRADAFNAFNFANYGNPDTGVTDSNFGVISGTRNSNGQRIIQLGLNYKF
jgi:Carboxypeptidase regulatory-like domain/TonB dependent receptor